MQVFSGLSSKDACILLFTCEKETVSSDELGTERFNLQWFFNRVEAVPTRTVRSFEGVRLVPKILFVAGVTVPSGACRETLSVPLLSSVQTGSITTVTLLAV